MNVALKTDCKYFPTIYVCSLKKYLAYISCMYGAFKKNAISSFFSTQANSQNIHKYLTYNIGYMIKPEINQKPLAVWHHLKKEINIIDKKKLSQNYPLLLNISNNSYFHS